MNPPPPTAQRGSVMLRPIEVADYPVLRRLELSGALGARWRLLDQPSPEHYASSLWDGVQAQHLAFDAATNQALGLITIYGMDTHNRVCRLAAARFENSLRSRMGFLSAFVLAVELTFTTYDIRKIYMDIPDFNFDPLRSFTTKGIMNVEGTLKEFRYYRGTYWDQHIVSIDSSGLAALIELLPSATT